MHILEVSSSEGENGEQVFEYDIIHADDCPTTVEKYGECITVTYYGCEVEWNLAGAGFDAFGEPLPREPGRYEIQAWQERYHSIDYGTEYDSGLTVVRRLPDNE